MTVISMSRADRSDAGPEGPDAGTDHGVWSCAVDGVTPRQVCRLAKAFCEAGPSALYHAGAVVRATATTPQR